MTILENVSVKVVSLGVAFKDQVVYVTKEFCVCVWGGGGVSTDKILYLSEHS